MRKRRRWRRLIDDLLLGFSCSFALVYIGDVDSGKQVMLLDSLHAIFERIESIGFGSIHGAHVEYESVSREKNGRISQLLAACSCNL